MTRTLHSIASKLALATIFCFFSSSLIADLMGSHEQLALVKEFIVYGLFLLIPAMAVTGATGAKMARGRKQSIVGAKRKRMKILAANGVLILVPAALLLNVWAQEGRFDTLFWTVQVVELIAGGVNLLLMGLNVRDGLGIKSRYQRTS